MHPLQWTSWHSSTLTSTGKWIRAWFAYALHKHKYTAGPRPVSATLGVRDWSHGGRGRESLRWELASSFHTHLRRVRPTAGLSGWCPSAARRRSSAERSSSAASSQRCAASRVPESQPPRPVCHRLCTHASRTRDVTHFWRSWLTKPSRVR